MTAVDRAALCTDDDGCDREAVARGLCVRHYGVARRRGTLDQHQTRRARALAEGRAGAASLNPDDAAASVAADLQRVRLERSWSQETVCEAMGRSRHADQVRRWESGETQPVLGSLVAWAAALGLRVALVPVAEDGAP